MMADTIDQTSIDVPIDNMLKGIDAGVRRLRQIINDMIDVSLIDNDLLSINRQPLRIGYIIKLLKNDLSEAIAGRKQQLVVEQFEGNNSMISGDIERLFQAIHNVALNAIKYTPDEGTIIMSGRLLPGFIEITVKDTGIGISTEHQSIIFEKFGQLKWQDKI
jgi:signal transduction histidine kinase